MSITPIKISSGAPTRDAKTVPAVEKILIPPIEKLFAIDIMNLR